MTWKLVTAEERTLFRQIMLWIRTVRETGAKYGNPLYGPDWLPSDSDFDKSALLERIRSGLQPMDEPPPVGFACPWYALVEDAGPHWVLDVRIDPTMLGEELRDTAIINQNGFTIYERRGETEFVVGDRRGTSYRFRLWYDAEWRHPSGVYRPNEGGWFMQNVAFASGMEARQGGNEVPSRSDDSSARSKAKGTPNG